MKLDKLDLIVEDVPTATAFFRDVVGLTARFAEERYAEFDAGPVTLMLSPEAMVPTRPASGVIVHLHVEDVGQAVERARQHGATVLLEPTHTDWGWESAMIEGPEEIVVDFYRPLEGTQPDAQG